MKMNIREKDEGIWEERIGLLRDHHELNSFTGSASAGSQLLQYERNLNFATVAMDDGEYGFPKKKTIRDPLSHRIIEKRRRDRMNNCLADLARLLPQASLRKGRGRIEKTEIVELAIKHLRHLQTHPCPHGDSCELNPTKLTGAIRKFPSGPILGNTIAPTSVPCISLEPRDMPQISVPMPVSPQPFNLGFQECLNEAMHFLLESKSTALIVNDSENHTKLCLQLAQHLNQHAERIFLENANKKMKLAIGYPSQASDGTINMNEFNQKQSGSPVSSGYLPNGTSPCGSDINCGHGRDLALVRGENLSCHWQNDIENNVIDFDADNNSCSSTPLSIEVSDNMSSDGRVVYNGHSSNTLTVPRMIWEKRSPRPRSTGCQAACTSTNDCRSSDESRGILSPTSHSHRYKFKNTIKQRFTADSQTKTESDTELNSSFSKLTQDNHPCEDQAQVFPENEPEISRESRDQLVSSPGSEGMPEMSTCRNAFPRVPRVSVVDIASLAECEDSEVTVQPRCATRGIPAFILHDKGSFYIPVTIDSSVIPDEAFFGNFDDQRCDLPLHPVTISVCYTKESKVPSGIVSSERKLDTSLAVSPSVIRNPIKAVEVMEEIPKSESNFIMNRFEESQIEAARRYHNHNSGLRETRCPPDSDINYRNFNVNQQVQHVYRLENGEFPKHDGVPDNKGIDNINMHTNSIGPMRLRKDPTYVKSAFVGYKSCRSSLDCTTITADLNSKRSISSHFVDNDQSEMPTIKIRKSNPADFQPRIVSNGTCSAHSRVSKE